jgi:histidinol-phosphate phosphatase family protein
MNALADVLILAGGFGTRMSQDFPNVPKPMIPVLGVPILERIILECRAHGFTKLSLLLHHQASQIIDYFGDGDNYGVDIAYVIEKTPLGTGGALVTALPGMADNFLVLYADVFIDVDLRRLYDSHIKSSRDFTVVAHPNNHPHDSDLLVLNGDNDVVAVSSHPHDPTRYLRNMVNAAMYVVRKKSIPHADEQLESKFDIAQHLIPRLIDRGKEVGAYVTVEYLKDMGTPDRLKKVEADLSADIPRSRRLGSARRKAIFLDRDGTLNVDVGYLDDPTDLELLPDVALSVEMLNKSPYLAICTTNQPVLARGTLSFEGFDEICSTLDMLLGDKGAYLDDLFFCPHHPDFGFEGEIVSLKKNCNCRKPGVGMYAEASIRHNIDLCESWVIGDRTADIRAGQNIGARTVLVQTGDAGRDVQYPTRPHFIAPNLRSAVEFILNSTPAIERFINSIYAEIAESSVVLVSGAARSGKSTLSKQLEWYAIQNGRSAHILELDCHLKPDRSESNNAADRYDWEMIRETIDLFLEHPSFPYQDFGFDHSTGRGFSLGFKNIGANPLLIVDGIFANILRDDLNLPALSIRVRQSSDLRYKRFKEKYVSRGKSSVEIKRLWDRRVQEEDVVVSNSCSNVDKIFSIDEM